MSFLVISSMFHDSQVVRNEIIKSIIFSSLKTSFNPSISSLELSWVIFHLKLSLRIVAVYGAYKWPKFFIYPLGEISFLSPC